MLSSISSKNVCFGRMTLEREKRPRIVDGLSFKTVTGDQKVQEGDVLTRKTGCVGVTNYLVSNVKDGEVKAIDLQHPGLREITLEQDSYTNNPYKKIGHLSYQD